MSRSPRAGVAGLLLLAIAGTGCMADQTRNMADTCNRLLEQDVPERRSISRHWTSPAMS